MFDEMDNLSNEDSEEEMFPIMQEFQTAEFVYNDPLSVSGILRAVVEEDLQKIKELVFIGKSLNINDNNGNTPLHVAVIKNNLEILQYIVEREEIPINAKNETGETALFLCTCHGHLELAQTLIYQGADVNIPDNFGTTPLHNAVRLPEIAHLLISHGADLDIPDCLYNTPLHIAVERECLETVCMLLYYEADANFLNKFNFTPFMKALLNRNVEIQEVLLNYVNDFDVHSTYDLSALHVALLNDSPFIENIINGGAKVDAKALGACIENPNVNNFRSVWTHLKLVELEGCREGQLLLELLSPKQTQKFRHYIDVILECSDSFALETLLPPEFGFDFSYVVHENIDILSSDQLTKLTCLFLQHGMILTTDTIAIFSYFGFSELLKILLFMDNTGLWANHVIAPRLAFDINTDVVALTKDIEAFSDECLWSLEDLEIFVGYWSYSSLLHCNKILFADNINVERLLSEKSGIPKVPSLLQLSRDEFRKYVINKFNMKKTSEYYTYVNHMDASTVYKQILTYEKKLYKLPTKYFQC